MKNMYREVLIIGILLGALIGAALLQSSQKPQAKIPAVVVGSPKSFSVNMDVPAVDNEGNGVAVEMSVEIKSGGNRILTNIDKLLFWVDTQQSMQIAKSVAEEVTKKETEGLDFIYTIDTNASIIGGPSAGAALTIATIAALEDKKPNKSVSITGTINPDGTIGAVGGVLEKAKAAKAVGKTLFLVPLGQGTQTVLKPQEKCTKKPGFVYCETSYEKSTTDISQNAGITVKEVHNVEEAIKYFI